VFGCVFLLIYDPQGQRVLIVDDVITAGTAIRQTMELLKAAEAEAVGVALALDRQERGTDSPLSAVQVRSVRGDWPCLPAGG
jgi:orotate phosphoribosyltransferase